MAEFTMNFDNAGPGENEILQPGWYSFEIVQAYDTTLEGQALQTQAGTPYIKMKCRENCSGLVLQHFLFLDEEQSKKVYYFLQATDNEPAQPGPVTISPAMFEGKSFRGKVEVKDGHNRITRANPAQAEQQAPFVPVEYEKPQQPDPDLNEDVPF